MSQNKANQSPKNLGSLAVSALIGSALTFAGYSFLGDNTSSEITTKSAEKKPLYWVAPMDANYKRDKPGKSPMGMDLVPVYEDGGSGADSGPSTIKISAEVVNNLGVRIAKVKNGILHSQISTVGYVKYNEDKLVHIHPRVEGWIEKLYIKAAGDPVEKDQALYEIYSPALVNAQEELLLALDRKNSRLIKAAEDRLHALQLPPRAIKQLKKIKQVQQTITFYAPQKGVVDNLNIREGFFVKPGTTLMSIGKLDQVWVEAEVFERQASEVAVGTPVTMSLAYLPGKEWQGEVDYVYPTLNSVTRTIKVRLRFNNQDQALKPNMFAQVMIHAQVEGSSLLIPKESVIRSGNSDRVVLALGEGRFKSINVKVGRYDDEYAEILSGLIEGEKVVSSAQFLLDSESSKSSDFKRMHFEDDTEAMPSSVWGEVTINSVMAGHRMVNVDHQAIEAWDWPEMTMDFDVSESVDISSLETGMMLHVEIRKTDEGNYEIVKVHIPDGSMSMGNDSQVDAVSSATVNGVINSVMTDHRMLNISREAIEAWGREAATLDFMVNEGVDMSVLKNGQKIQFTFHLVNGEFLITDIQSSPDHSKE